MAAHRSNPADLLKSYTVAELERIASGFHPSNNINIPVDIDLLLEQTPGVDLDCCRGLKDNHGLLGMAGTSDGGALVVYIDDFLMDHDASIRLYRMTVAEGLAHIILHRNAIEAVRDPSDFLALHNHPRWYEFERNAKRLAAALLMPAANLIQDSQSFYRTMITNWPSGESWPSLPVVMNTLAGHLADRYVVSVATMKYRLNEWPVKVEERVKKSLESGVPFME